MSQSKVIYGQGDIFNWMRSQNRKIWALALTMVLVSAGTLYLCLASLWRPIPVVVFDAAGKPTYIADTRTPAEALTDLRIRYFVKQFIHLWVGIDSGAIERDFAAALNMMTPKLRHMAESTGEEAKRRARYAGGNVTTSFADIQIKLGRYNPQDPTAQITGYAWGQMTARPKVASLKEPVEDDVQYFLSVFIVDRVPISEAAIHGLAIDHFEALFFHSKKEFEDHILSRVGRTKGGA